MISVRSVQTTQRILTFRSGIYHSKNGSQMTTTTTFVGRRFMSSNGGKGSISSSSGAGMTQSERNDAIREANKQMQGYVETRILAKQGKLPSKRKGPSAQSKSAHRMQVSMLVSLVAAFIASPILGKKIAQDDEFREKYVPSYFDFRVKSSESAWTRQELHEQLVEVERDMRERAIKGEFTPEKLAELKGSMQTRSDLTEEDLYYAKKYGWGRVHPGVDPDDDDEDDD